MGSVQIHLAALATAGGGRLHVKVSSSRLPGGAYRGSVHVVTDASAAERSESAMEDAMAMAAHDFPERRGQSTLIAG